jgi:hypothetical protein
VWCLAPHIVHSSPLGRFSSKLPHVLANTAAPKLFTGRGAAHQHAHFLPLQRCLHLRLAHAGLGLEESA